ncbi:zinc finger, CCHC-type containing protein, partial [Tanacetum coccineum]
MAGNTVKEMTTNFGKLDKFEGHDFRRWQKKRHFLLTTLKVVYVLTTPMPELMEDDTVEAIRRRAKWENDDYICKGHILNCMSDSLFDVYQNVESAKGFYEIHSNTSTWQRMLRVRSLLILGQYTQHGLKMDESISISSIINKLPPSWKDFKHTLKHGKDDLSLVQLGSHLRIEDSLRAQDNDKGKGKEVDGPSVNMTEEVPTRNLSWNVRSVVRLVTSRGIALVVIRKAQMLVVREKGLRTNPKIKVDAIAWWIDFDATTHVCKDRCWFKTYEPVKDGSVLYMGDDNFAHAHRKGSVVLEFSLGKSITLFNVLYVPKLRKNLISGLVLNKCGYKQVYEFDKYILSKSGVFVGFGYYNYDRSGEYYDPVFFQSVGIIHDTTALYTPQQNGVAEKKNNALKEMVNSMLSYSGLSEGFWGEAIAVVRLSNSKRKTLDEKGIDCIFVGYAEHSKAYRFYVIEPNDSVSINSIIESRDAIFDESRFSSIPRLKDIIPNSVESQRDDHYDDVPSETPEPHKGKKVRKAKSYGFDFQLYLVEGSRYQVGLQYSYCYSIEEDPRTYNEAMQSWDAAFWKEAIDDEIASIMKNNTWVLFDLPPGCKPLGCKWIFKRKMKVDGTINKFKARLVIQGFRKKEGIDYFDTYALVTRITTIRLLLALEAIHNPVIHQMDVKTSFLNGDLEEEVYMKQSEGFVMPVNKTKKFLSSRFSMKDMGEADVILGIKIKRDNKGIVITQSHYIEKILKYVVPTGRVVVPTDRYVVPAGKVIIIVSPGRLSLVPTGRVLSPGSDNESDDASVHSEATIAQQQQNIQPQIITTVSNNNAKFPYLKKDEYEVWAMKMEYWITNNDMNIWKVIQNGNSLKRTGRDRDGRVIILPPTTADEHIAVQRESKARTTLLQSIPDDHVADFHYMDDARDIWNAVKARFGGNAESKKMRKSMLKQEFSEFRISEAEGLHKGYDRMQKILSQLNQLKAKPEDEDINLKFLRALPSSWSQVALTLKTKGGLELLSFDDLYYKLKTLEVDIKGYSTFSSSQSAGPSHSAFVSTTSASKKMSYADSPSYSSSTYTAPSNSKTGSHRSGNVIEDVLQSFVADTEPEQQLAYEDFEQIEKMDLEEMDLKWQMAMLSVRVHKFEQKAGRKIDFDKKESARFNKKKVRCYKCLQRGHFARECRAKGGNDKQRYSSFKIQEIGKKEEDSKALITVDTLVDWTEHDGQSDGVIAPKEFGMIAGCDTEDAIEEGAAKIYNLITGADTKEASTAGDAGEFALIGVTFEVHNCPFGCDNKYNELQKQHNELNE